jgi:hypothetical protein
MRYLIGGQMGWLAVPFVALVGVAYVWVMERLLGETAKVVRREETPSVKKAA